MFRVKITFNIDSADINQVTSGFENFSDASQYLDIISKNCKEYLGGHIEEKVQGIGWVVRDEEETEEKDMSYPEFIKDLIDISERQYGPMAEEGIARLINSAFESKRITTEEMLVLCGAFGICDVRKYWRK